MAKEKQCPYRFGLPEKQRGCIEHQCALYQRVTGLHPQTGVPIDEYACALAWMPMLMIEASGQQIKSTAAVNKVATIIFGGMSPAARDRILEENPTLRPPEQRKELTNGSPGGTA